MAADIKSFLEPSSIAVVGASSKEGKAGHAIVRNLIDFGFEGKIFPINPTEKAILGREAFPSVGALPGPVDVAVIAVPAPSVLNVVKECASNGVKFGVIISAGFKEATKEGGAIQDRIVEAARQKGMRLIGPNCLGFVNAHKNLVAVASPFTGWMKGGSAFVSQSGVMAGAFAKWIVDTQKSGIGISISLGNKCDLDEAEIIDGYLKDDPNTKVIGVYDETIKDGRRFMRTMKEVTKKKPVVLIKSGRTTAGAAAAFSHTGSLAADDKITDAALRQSGVIRADSFNDMIDIAKTFEYSQLPKGRKVGIVTFSGASSVLAVDLLSEYGLELALFDGDIPRRVEKEIMPPWQPAKNPLDVWIALGAGADKVHRVAIGSMLENPNADMVLAILLSLPASNFNVREVFSNFTDLAKQRPLLVSIEGDRKGEEWWETLEDMRVPTFIGANSMERAVRCMSSLYTYARRTGRVSD